MTTSFPTAGAAAAAAAAASAAIAAATAAATRAAGFEVSDEPDTYDDTFLLSELASHSRTNPIDWSNLQSPRARDRWNLLLQNSHVPNASELSVPELAQLLLDEQTSAQRAAETLQAVDLPSVT